MATTLRPSLSQHDSRFADCSGLLCALDPADLIERDAFGVLASQAEDDLLGRGEDTAAVFGLGIDRCEHELAASAAQPIGVAQRVERPAYGVPQLERTNAPIAIEIEQIEEYGIGMDRVDWRTGGNPVGLVEVEYVPQVVGRLEQQVVGATDSSECHLAGGGRHGITRKAGDDDLSEDDSSCGTRPTRRGDSWGRESGPMAAVRGP